MTGTEAVDRTSAAGEPTEAAPKTVGGVSQERHGRKTIKNQPPNNKQLNVSSSVAAQRPFQKYISWFRNIY